MQTLRNLGSLRMRKSAGDVGEDECTENKSKLRDFEEECTKGAATREDLVEDAKMKHCRPRISRSTEEDAKPGVFEDERTENSAETMDSEG